MEKTIFTEKVWIPSVDRFVFQESKDPQSGEKSYILKGLMLPFNTISRNRVLYNKDSIGEKCDNLVGRPLMYNHQVDGRDDLPFGHFTQSVCLDGPQPGWEKVYKQPGWYYEADIDPEEKNIIRKLKRGDLRHVSIQLIGDRVEEKYEKETGNDYTEAWVGDIIEGSLVPAPGFLDTTAQFAEALHKKEGFKVGDIIHSPSGTGKITKVTGDKLIVQLIDGTKIPIEVSAKDARKEAVVSGVPKDKLDILKKKGLIKQIVDNDTIIIEDGKDLEVKKLIHEEDMNTDTASGAVAPGLLPKKKESMPDGWTKVTWSDSKGNKYSDSIPNPMLDRTKMNILSAGGKIIKIEESCKESERDITVPIDGKQVTLNLGGTGNTGVDDEGNIYSKKDGKWMKEFFDSSSAREIDDDKEMLKASISAELDASSLYREYARKTNNEEIKKVMLSVADEEDVHVGEFLLVLKKIDPEYVINLMKGEKEVDSEKVGAEPTQPLMEEEDNLVKEFMSLGDKIVEKIIKDN